MENSINVEETPEAIQAEENALKISNEEEIRNQLIDKYGLDPELNGDFIDQLTADKIEEQKKLSIAIKQKRNWRDKAMQQPEVKPQVEEKPMVDTSQFVTKADLEEIELNTLGVDDELKQQVKSYASMNKVSFKEALKSDYISFLKDKLEKQARLDEASIQHKNNSSAGTTIDISKPFEGDISTKEGREAFALYRKAVEKNS